jgi:DNA-cytosine methyltransferase
MKYISFFSGIGGFEHSIHSLFPNAECVGYSEIDPHAIKVYSHHYPNHKNLGDITTITKENIQTLGSIDLVVAGFPCTNLTRISYLSKVDTNGIDGKKSGLFHDLLRIMKYIHEINPSFHFIIENNASMTTKNKELITSILQSNFPNVHAKVIDNSSMGVQIRKRIFWINHTFQDIPYKVKQTWDNVLVPYTEAITYICSDKDIEYLNNPFSKTTLGKVLYKANIETHAILGYPQDGRVPITRLQSGFTSDNGSITNWKYPIGKSRPLLGGGASGILIDRRNNDTLIRWYAPTEMERLFGFPDNYVTNVIKNKQVIKRLLGNSVCIFTIQHVLKHFIDLLQ